MAKKILIIDDEQDFVETLSFYLRDNGFEVFDAANGTIGIEKAQAEKPDLIILDLMMPDIDGYEAAKRLKVDNVTVNIPIIVFTASITPDLKEKIKQIQVVDYVVKPCDLEELVDKIKKILEG
ncbi:MAG: response regulator [Candidatus Omnitrophota bacterium]